MNNLVGINISIEEDSIKSIEYKFNVVNRLDKQNITLNNINMDQQCLINFFRRNFLFFLSLDL